MRRGRRRKKKNSLKKTEKVGRSGGEWRVKLNRKEESGGRV